MSNETADSQPNENGVESRPQNYMGISVEVDSEHQGTITVEKSINKNELEQKALNLINQLDRDFTIRDNIVKVVIVPNKKVQFFTNAEKCHTKTDTENQYGFANKQDELLGIIEEAKKIESDFEEEHRSEDNEPIPEWVKTVGDMAIYNEGILTEEDKAAILEKNKRKFEPGPGEIIKKYLQKYLDEQSRQKRPTLFSKLLNIFITPFKRKNNNGR